MTFHTTAGGKWRQFVRTVRELNQVSFVPEYANDNERSLNHRYYR